MCQVIETDAASGGGHRLLQSTVSSLGFSASPGEAGWLGADLSREVTNEAMRRSGEPWGQSSGAVWQAAGGEKAEH